MNFAAPIAQEPLATAEFADALREALARHPHSISPKYFYDARGAALFEAICDLPEYYPTRTELGLYERHAAEMAQTIGPDAEIIEFGAGAMTKIRVLLRALQNPRRYVPLDISDAHLHASAAALALEFPTLAVTPVAMDFSLEFALPAPAEDARRRVGFFPGSSLGNFSPSEAERFLATAARALRGGGLLIGIDLVKDPNILHAAYNDTAGITAAFNRNLLVRANRELGTRFVPAEFAHYAFFNPPLNRVEMHLLCLREQHIQLGDETFTLAAGASLHTENSYKYTLDGFRSLARSAGFEPREVWCDGEGWFSVHWLAAPG
jgi:dimethylhistidine N-methyltransferase